MDDGQHWISFAARLESKPIMLQPYHHDRALEWYQTRDAKTWATDFFRLQPLLSRLERTMLMKSILKDTQHYNKLAHDYLWKAPDSFASEMKSLSVIIAMNKAIVSSCQNIPQEVLSYIFELVPNKGSHFPKGFIVSQVCSRWRWIAVSSPHLWTVIRLYDNRILPELFEQWLTYSGADPLEVAIGRRVNQALLPLALNTVSRWDSLLITVNDYIPVMPITGTRSSSASRLPKRSINFTRLQSRTIVERAREAKALRYIELDLPGTNRVDVPQLDPILVNANSFPSLERVRCHVHISIPSLLMVQGALPEISFRGIGLYCRSEDSQKALQLEMVLITESFALGAHLNCREGDFLFLKALDIATKSADSVHVHTIVRSLAIMAPNLTYLALREATNISLPPMTTLETLAFRIRPEITSEMRETFRSWFNDSVPNIQVLALEDIIWIELGIVEGPSSSSIIRQLYDRTTGDVFCASEIDHSQVHCWKDPWFMCFAKRTKDCWDSGAGIWPSVVDHPFYNIEPMERVFIEGSIFSSPYLVDLNAKDLDAVVKAVSLIVIDFWG